MHEVNGYDLKPIVSVSSEKVEETNAVDPYRFDIDTVPRQHALCRYVDNLHIEYEIRQPAPFESSHIKENWNHNGARQ